MFKTKRIVTRAERAIATRKRNARMRKFFRGYAWFIAYSAVSIMAISFCLAWYATSFEAVTQIVTPKIAIAEVYDTPTTEDTIRSIGGDYGAIMVKLAQCESGLRQFATNANTNGTVDRGVFQINSVHKDLTDECTFSVECASKWTLNKLTKKQGHIWTCWKQL